MVVEFLDGTLPILNLLQWLKANASAIVVLLGLLTVSGYYLFAWNRVGRDPPEATLIPVFKPPEGLSPATMRGLIDREADVRGLGAALIGLAVKGYLTIEADGRSHGLTKQTPSAPAGTLAPSERALHDALPSTFVAVSPANAGILRSARQALNQSLHKDYPFKVHRPNLLWCAGGFGLSFAVMYAGIFVTSDTRSRLMLAAVMVYGMCGLFLGIGYRQLITDLSLALRRGKRPEALRELMPLIVAAVFMPILFFGLALYEGGLRTADYILFTMGLLLVLVNLVGLPLLGSFTPAGRHIMNQIAGFKLYLETAEQDRLKVLHEERTGILSFEPHLPYAVALACENAWGDRFIDELVAATSDDAARAARRSGSAATLEDVLKTAYQTGVEKAKAERAIAAYPEEGSPSSARKNGRPGA